MDKREILFEKTVERLKSKIYPCLFAGWKLKPPTVAKFLESYEPAHVISILNKGYYVDGLPLQGFNEIDVDSKREIAYRALEQVYGRFVRTADRPHVVPSEYSYTLSMTEKLCDTVLSSCKTPTTAWLLEFNELKNAQTNLLLCFFHRQFRRFAFEARLRPTRYSPGNQVYLPKPTQESILFAPVNGSSWIPYLEFGVSRNFFASPKPENALILGDLCLLSQSCGGWKIKRKISLENFPYKSFQTTTLSTIIFGLVQWLKNTVGFQTFIKNAYIQLLLQDEKTPSIFFWRSFLEFAEQEKINNQTGV